MGRRKPPPSFKPCLSLRTSLENEDVGFRGAASVSVDLTALARGLMSEARLCPLRCEVSVGVILL